MSVRIERPEPHLTALIIDRPERRNAFDTDTARRLADAFGGIGPEVRALIVHGAGGHFCSGADVKEREGMTDERWQEQHRLFEVAFSRLRAVAAPVVAAVEGVALGGGFELALSCDLIVCGRSARFSFPEVTRGIVPGLGGMALLARRAGPGRAKELVLTGRILAAEEAAAWGVANLVVDDGDTMAHAVALASTLAANAPVAVREAKKAIESGFGRNLEETVEMELEAYSRVVPTEDRREGIRAFNEGRPARFKGR